jgi:hypothetical protein
MALAIDNLNRDIYYSEPIKNSVGKGIKSLLGRIGPNNKKLIDNLKIVKENIFTFQTYIFSTKKNEISDELLDYTKDLRKVETNIINEDRLNRIIDHISYFVNIENYNIDNITHLLDKDKISIDKYIENYNLDPNKQEVDKIIFTEKEKLDINTELMFNNVQKAYFLINNGTIKYIGYYKKLIKNIKSKELEEQKKQQDIYKSQLKEQADLQTKAMAIFQENLEKKFAETKSTELGQPNARIEELEKPNARIEELEKQLAAATATKDGIIADLQAKLAASTATKEALNAKFAAATANTTKDGKIVQLEQQIATLQSEKDTTITDLQAKIAAATKPIEPVNAKITDLEEKLSKIKGEKEALESKISLDNSTKISVKSGVNPKKEDIIQLILFLSESRLEIEKLKLESKKVADPASESITSGVNMKPSVNMKPGVNMKEISRIIDAYKNIGSSGPNDTGKKESFEKLITEYKETYKLNTKIKAILESIKL